MIGWLLRRLRRKPRPTIRTFDDLPSQDRAVFEPHTEEWFPPDLIGRFRDVTHCDHCRREFRPTDDGYLAFWVTSPEDLRLLAEVQREQSPERPAGSGTTGQTATRETS